MEFQLPGKVTVNERKDRTATLLALVFVVVLAGGAWAWFHPEHQKAKMERSFLWRVVFSDERITSQVGRVKDAHIEQERSASGRRSHDAHRRKSEGNVVIGSIVFLVIGEKGAGRAVIRYRSNHESGKHLVTDISMSLIWSTKTPNKTPEPTRMLGTSAAEQPLVPSTRVAHL